MMPSRKSEGWPTDAIYAENQAETTEELPHADETVQENTATTEDEPRDNYEEAVIAAELLTITNTLMPTSPVRCSTERTTRKSVRDSTATPLVQRSGKVL